MSKDKQTILMVHNYYQLAGGEDTVLAGEQALLEANGHKVVRYTRHNNELAQLNILQKLALPFTSIFNLRTYRAVKAQIKAEQVDVVHVHNTLTLVSPAVYYAALHCNVPVVQTIHNFRLLCPAATFYRGGHICEDCPSHGLLCAVKRGCYRGSKLQTLLCVLNTKIHRMTGVYKKLHYICLTEFNKEKLLQHRQINAAQISVKPNFVQAIGAVVPYEARDDQIVFAGRLEKLKGIDVLLQAWQLLEAEGTQQKLILCGTGPMQQWCEDYIAQHGLQNVQLKGFVPNDEMRRIIAHAKALVQPSQWYEGFPMTIAEAYSVGTPVIGSAMGNVGSLVKDEATGKQFAYHSPQALAKALQQFAANAPLQAQCSVQAHQTYLQYYAPEKNYEILAQIYRNLR